MRSVEEVARVRLLVADGLNDCEIARQTGIPRSTVREWRSGRSRSGTRLDRHATSCPDRGHAEHDFEALPEWHYAYLLGLYLGDGHIAHLHRGVYALRIALDRKYPGIISDCQTAIWWVTGGKNASLVPAPGCFNVQAYWKSWPCLFPQHGPGVKHQRKIELSDWQRVIVAREPEALLRGLIHSDGWRGMNRVTVKGKQYVYPRYQFCNVSDDIRQIFCDACDAVGVDWRRMNVNNISVAKRASVALMDEFVGPKR
jgi:hypothetical protein